MRTRIRVGLVGVALALLGCGSSATDALKKRLVSLEDQLAVMQNAQHQLENRLAALQGEKPKTTGKKLEPEPSAPQGEPASDRPLLDVVKLAPSPTPPSDTARGDGPPGDGPKGKGGASPANGRPAIRSRGDAVESTLPADSPADTTPRPIIRGSGVKIEGQHLDDPTSSRTAPTKRDGDQRFGEDPASVGRPSGESQPNGRA